MCRLKTNHLWRDCLLEIIEREFARESYLALKELEDRSSKLSENIITELNERKKAIKIDHFYMELCMYFKLYLLISLFVDLIFIIMDDLSSRVGLSKTYNDKKTKKTTK